MPQNQFSQALQHHQQGKLREAERLYAAVPVDHAQYAEAQNNLAAIALQAGNAARACQYLERAIEVVPARGQFWMNYSYALQNAGRSAEIPGLVAKAREAGVDAAALQVLVNKSVSQNQAASGESSSESRHVSALVDAFNAGKFGEMETLARSLTRDSPTSGIYWKALGTALKMQNRADEAVAALSRALESSPNDTELLTNLGVVLRDLGRIDEAKARWRRAVEVDSSAADARYNLATLQFAEGNFADAETGYRAVLALRPSSHGVMCRLAETLIKKGNVEEAEKLLRVVLRSAPDSTEALEVLGPLLLTLKKHKALQDTCREIIARGVPSPRANEFLGRALQAGGDAVSAAAALRTAVELDANHLRSRLHLADVLMETAAGATEAESCLRQSLALDPTHLGSMVLLFKLFSQMGRLDEALSTLSNAMQAHPRNEILHSELGRIQLLSGNLVAAEASFRRALELKPDYPEAMNDLAGCLIRADKAKEAETYFRLALMVKPSDPKMHMNLGMTLLRLGRNADAAEAFRASIGLEKSVNAYDMLGLALVRQRDAEGALAAYRNALKLAPQNPLVPLHNLVSLYNSLGRFEEAAEYQQKVLALDPHSAAAHTNWLFSLPYSGRTSEEEYLRQARQWEGRVLSADELQQAAARKLSRQPRSGRRLRVGYVSGDFRKHVMAYFTASLFSHHDKAQFEVFLYATMSPQEKDDVTLKFKGLGEHWRELGDVPKDQALEIIQRDEIDVLIDLSGHTGCNRLELFALRAAPVQCHYMGYFASTGLSQMDYWIGDEVLLPKSVEPYFSEKLWRLPRVWLAYSPEIESPDIDWTPSADGVRFGCFATLGKITERSLDVWAEILRGLPRSRLVLKGLNQGGDVATARLQDGFRARNVSPQRVSILKPTHKWRDHMKVYNEIDVVLDPVGGLSGGTTTCEALWMGAPLITMAGRGMAQRMAAAIVSGLPALEWVAQDEKEYVQKAIALAANLPSGVQRQMQRHKMMDSEVCDPQGLACALEAAYTAMFDRWFEHAAVA